MYIVHMCVSVCAHMHVSLQKNLCLVCSNQANMLHKFNLYILQIKLDINLKKYIHTYIRTHNIQTYTYMYFICICMYTYTYIQNFCFLFNKSCIAVLLTFMKYCVFKSYCNPTVSQVHQLHYSMIKETQYFMNEI